jgi:hypothetical protein
VAGGSAGGRDEDPELILAALAEGIEALVAALGRDAVQRAFAATCGHSEGALDAVRFVGMRQEDAGVARRAVHRALAMLSPVIGWNVVAYLSGSVRRLADGSKLENILTIGGPSRVRHDPMSRSLAIMKTRIASEVLRQRGQSNDPSVRGAAFGLLKKLGLPAKKPRGITVIEHALLAAIH